MRKRDLVAILQCLLMALAGCGEKEKLDPTINGVELGDMQLSLVKSPVIQEYLPIKIITSLNETDRWVVTVVKLNDSQKRAKFQIDKKTKNVLRLKD